MKCLIKRQLFYYLPAILLVSACTHAIKNPEAEVIEEEGTTVTETDSLNVEEQEEVITSAEDSVLIGYWVGWFIPDEGQDMELIIPDADVYWFRENKINICVNNVTKDSVFGYSVVAGNKRPFSGSISTNDFFSEFELKEPGDHKYDGTFHLRLKQDTLIGTWQAFNKIDISKRKYKLTKKRFSYNKDVLLDEYNYYVNWNKYIDQKETYGDDPNDYEEWIQRSYATISDSAFSINASNTLLKKEDVDNLRRSDLSVIRNTIYARHGYSFKNRPLRVFFDAQSWYIPVDTDVRSELTEIEKKNIKLLMQYEKNAAEYYDYFGRG